MLLFLAICVCSVILLTAYVAEVIQDKRRVAAATSRRKQLKLSPVHVSALPAQRRLLDEYRAFRILSA